MSVTSLSHRPWAKHVDMYAKIPADLMEGTRSGSALSYISLCIMLILFLYETSAFFSSRYGDTLAFFAINGLGSYQGISSHVMSHNVPFCKIDRLVTDLSLDRSDDPRIRLNFNITMMDLRCDWAVIDVVSVLGTHQNVKGTRDAIGIKKILISLIVLSQVRWMNFMRMEKMPFLLIPKHWSITKKNTTMSLSIFMPRGVLIAGILLRLGKPWQKSWWMPERHMQRFMAKTIPMKTMKPRKR